MGRGGDKMKTVIIEGVLNSAAVFSDRPALGNEISSLSYIPGTTFRGAIASTYLGQTSDGKPDDVFNQIFGEEKIQFPNLYPFPGCVIPFSAATCKVYRGFFTEIYRLGLQVIESHGIVDRHFLEDGTVHCPKEGCDHSLVPIDKQFYNPNLWQRIEADQWLQMRTSVTKDGVAGEGSLRTVSELTRGNRFHGQMRGEEALITALQERLGDRFSIYAGKRRFGKIALQMRDDSLKNFSKEEVLFERPGKSGTWAVMKFESDVILIDSLLRPVCSITNEILQDLLHSPTVEVVSGFVKTRRVAGWSGVGKLFRPDDFAMRAGSTFLLRFENSSTQEVFSWITELTDQGIGLRRGEGFGRVRFDDPIHRLSISEEGRVI